jgi:hypothetical protein
MLATIPMGVVLRENSQGRGGRDLRVGASVGHGEQTGAGVLVLEVLIGELLAVDGATTGALFREKQGG